MSDEMYDLIDDYVKRTAELLEEAYAAQDPERRESLRSLASAYTDLIHKASIVSWGRNA